MFLKIKRLISFLVISTILFNISLTKTYAQADINDANFEKNVISPQADTDGSNFTATQKTVMSYEFKSIDNGNSTATLTFVLKPDIQANSASLMITDIDSDEIYYDGIATKNSAKIENIEVSKQYAFSVKFPGGESYAGTLKVTSTIENNSVVEIEGLYKYTKINSNGIKNTQKNSSTSLVTSNTQAITSSTVVRESEANQPY